MASAISSGDVELSRGGIQTALTQAYIGKKKEEFKQEVQGLVGLDGFTDEPTDGIQNQKTVSRTLWTSAVFIVVAGALGMNIFAILVYKGTMTYAAGLFAALTAVWVAISELQLEDLPTLRQVQNNLREDVNHFALQNTQLHTSVNGLATNVAQLKGTEEQFKALTKAQSINMTSLMTLVKDAKEINADMNQCIRRDLVSQLIATALDQEKNESGEFDDKELKRLLNFMEGLPAVTINQPLLLDAMKENRSLVALVNLIMDVYQSGKQRGDQIFIIDESSPELQEHVLAGKV